MTDPRIYPGWEGWTTLPDRVPAVERYLGDGKWDGTPDAATIFTYGRTVGQLEVALRKYGWQGMGVWRVVPLPLDGGSNFCGAVFAMKQEGRGGWTYICSPRELPWLREEYKGTAEVRDPGDWYRESAPPTRASTILEGIR